MILLRGLGQGGPVVTGGLGQGFIGIVVVKPESAEAAEHHALAYERIIRIREEQQREEQARRLPRPTRPRRGERPSEERGPGRAVVASPSSLLSAPQAGAGAALPSPQEVAEAARAAAEAQARKALLAAQEAAREALRKKQLAEDEEAQIVAIMAAMLMDDD